MWTGRSRGQSISGTSATANRNVSRIRWSMQCCTIASSHAVVITSDGARPTETVSLATEAPLTATSVTARRRNGFTHHTVGIGG